MKETKRILRITSALLVSLLISNTLGCGNAVRPSSVSATVPAADALYRKVLATWSGGDQAGAEVLAAQAVSQFPDDQRLAFFQAACTRSRFEVQEAYPMFIHVNRMDPTTVQGKCSLEIAQIDAKLAVWQHFLELRDVVKRDPTDPIPLWMLAVECRSLNRNVEGIGCYQKLLTMVHPGPVLVHQTFANLLDEVGRHSEALGHRELAVKMEPAPWSYGGWAITLDDLGQHEKAKSVRKKAAKMFSLPPPAPPPPSAGSPYIPPLAPFPNWKRRSLYHASEAFDQHLFASRHNKPVSTDDPEILAFLKRNKITAEQLDSIEADGQRKRWYLTPAQRRRAGFPP